MKMRKVLSAFLAIVCMFSSLGIGTLGIFAEDSDTVYATTSASVTQGSNGYCYVYLDDLTDLAALTVSVYYDSEKVSVVNRYNSVNCTLYDSSDHDGCLQFTYLFDGKGSNSKTQLFYFQYKVAGDADPGETYFDIVVSEAYDSSLNTVNLSGSRCKFTIQKSVVNKTCNIYSTSSISTGINQEFSLSYRFSTPSIASGSFVIRYDAELFQLVELSQSAFLNNKIVDVKSDTPGAIYVSFVGTEYSSSTYLVNAKFKTIQNVDQTSQIKLTVNELYDLDLNRISCSGYTTNAKIAYDSTYADDAPAMALTPTYSAKDQQVTVKIKLDKDSHLGAGDFVLSFNLDYFTYRSATKGFSPSFFYVNDKKAAEGVIKFSIISLTDIVSAETVLTVVFDVSAGCKEFTEQFELNGSGLADSLTRPILLDFQGAKQTIPGLGHALTAHVAKAPTCTEIGWNAHETCSRCDYTTYEAISATGHNYVDTICQNCGEKQNVAYTWDVSKNADGSMMAYAYKLSDGTYRLEIVGSGEMKDYYHNAPWYNIGIYQKITHVIMDDAITSIGEYAFSSCKALERVDLPDGLLTIGERAFNDCRGLVSIDLPDSLQTIGQYAFHYCIALKTVELPDSLLRIDQYAFYDCSALKLIVLPGSLTDIGASAFLTCPKLSTVICKSAGMAGMLSAYYSVGYLTQYATTVMVPKAATQTSYLKNNYPITEVGLIDGEEYIIYSKSAHSWISTTVIPMVQCKTDGLTHHVCSDCGVYKDTVVSCHELISLEGKEPTCVEDGWKAYDICFYCDYTTYEVLPATGPYGEGGHLYHDLICVRCGADQLPDYSWDVSQQSNGSIIASAYLIEDGNYLLKVDGYGVMKRYTYDPVPWSSIRSKLTKVIIQEGITGIGDYNFRDSTALTTVILPQSLTSIGIEAFQYCSALESIDLPDGLTTIGGAAFAYCSKLQSVVIPEGVTKLEYETFYSCKALQLIVLPKSLTTIGFSAFYNCSQLKTVICKSSAVVKSIYSASSMGYLVNYATTVTIPQTATQPSYLKNNYPITESAVIDGMNYIIYSKSTHTWSSAVMIPVVQCQSDGLMRHTCTKCGVYKDTVLPRHDMVHYNAQAPTCTEFGWEAYEACAHCDYSTYVEIPATGHSMGNWVVTTAPTCLSKGTERRDCANCNHFETREVNALGHNLTGHSAKAPTCTEIGWEAYETCSRCNHTTYQELPATGHSYKSVVTTSTCTDRGYTTHICTVCGDSYIDSYTNAKGHSMGNWVVTTAPTCLAMGAERRDCANCDHFETREVNALGHNLTGHSSKAPTCTAIGWNAYETCSRCDHSTYKELPAKGHSYKAVVTAPTCTDRGYTTHTCTVCGDSYVDSYTNAKGHSMGAWTVTKAPTCTANGSEQSICTICQHMETRTVAALGHDLVHHEAKAPTFTEHGWNAYDTCKRCEYSTYVEIPAAGYDAGDINGDGMVNEADMNALRSYLSNVPCSVIDSQLDVNGDGKINMRDVARIAQIIYGIKK